MEFSKQIENLFSSGTAAGLTDGQLLERFLERRGEDAEAAFAAIVDRHGAMVLRVCRQVLNGEEDAEDAAQATFLVLTRRARSISRRESLACWLHGVALRVAANARVAAARRRAHERRGGEMRVAAKVVDPNFEAVECHEDWVALHNELGSLSRSFREPLILCYIDGLTQEQAAAKLRCPLGTIQSRLARGRAKLKARLEKRGASLTASFAGANGVTLQSCPAPQAWAEATVRLAMQFAQGKAAAVAGARAASALLAEETTHAVVLTKLKSTAALILLSATLLASATAWAVHTLRVEAPTVAKNFVVAPAQPEPEPVQKNAPIQPELVTRTIHGIVRDEQGRPIAKTWIGRETTAMEDFWEIVWPPDRIRERAEPFKNERGEVVPAGNLGKYFEFMDTVNWDVVDPAAIRPFDPARNSSGRAQAVPDDVKTALEKGTALFEIRRAKSHWEMSSLSRNMVADRTDLQGQFAFELEVSTRTGAAIRFASPDFSQQAIGRVHVEDADKPIEITLRPVRLVRARVIETPDCATRSRTGWSAYAIDTPAAGSAKVPGTGNSAWLWQTGALVQKDAVIDPGDHRQLEMHLCAGRYWVSFSSDSLDRSVSLTVPPGDGPLDLPDIRVESVAWMKMLGKPAAEIEAVDGDGKTVKLADFRGKVIVLTFWSTELEATIPVVPRLAEIQRRFKAQPLVVLALHDASITSAEGLKRAVVPLRARLEGAAPFHFLLDQVPGGQGGTTADAYNATALGLTLLIDRKGNLVLATMLTEGGSTTYSVSKGGQLVRSFGISPDLELAFDLFERSFEMVLLGMALEDQFGLPRSPLPDPEEPPLSLEQPKALTIWKGNVVDLGGKPIVGAKVSESRLYIMETPVEVETGPSGEFVLSAPGEPSLSIDVKVEATGFTTRSFRLVVRNEDRIEPPYEYSSVAPSGAIRHPLRMGQGVHVRGRVLKDGNPVAGVSMGLALMYFNPVDLTASERARAKTDVNGLFEFPHVRAETSFWLYAEVGSLADGGSVIPLQAKTGGDGSTFDVGPLQIRKGHILAGRLIRSESKELPEGLLLRAGCSNAGGSIKQRPGPTGRFEFKGLPDGPVWLQVADERPGVEARFGFSAKNLCRNPESISFLEGQLDHDITDLTILLDPNVQSDGPPRPPLPLGMPVSDRNPAALADFNDAKAGPITGVPPRLDEKQ